jgi:hypothetical protein
MNNQQPKNDHWLEDSFGIDSTPLRQHIGARLSKSDARKYEVAEREPATIKAIQKSQQ